MTGVLHNAIKKANKVLEKQVGETFGDYEQIMLDDEYEGFKQSRDRGYLLYFEQEPEARFLTNNNIFQKLI